MMIDVFRKKVIPLLNKDRQMPVNFVWGDSAYIREYLLSLKKSSSTAAYRFPVIGLYSPFDERKNNGVVSASVNLILAVNTLVGYTNEQRMEVSFESVLRPLYSDFMKALEYSRSFEMPYNGFNHAYVENFSFGKRGALDVDGKEIDEKIDAIEIKNLDLTLKKLDCYANRL
jgi:hypothetical protein